MANAILTRIEAGATIDGYGLPGVAGATRWTGRAGVDVDERVRTLANGNGGVDQIVTRTVELPAGLVQNGGGLLQLASGDVLVVIMRGVERRLVVNDYTVPGASMVSAGIPPITVAVQEA